MGQLEKRNKEVVLRFAEARGGNSNSAHLAEIFAPRYRVSRHGLFHLSNNAHGQGFSEPDRRSSDAFTDREDRIETVVAEGHRVALQWQMSATHTGNLFGIPPTGKRIKIWELALFNLARGKITEGWFMADELGLLIQLGATLPARKDGVPYSAVPAVGQTAPEALLEELRARPNPTRQDRNKINLLDKKIARLEAADVAAYEAARTSRPRTSGGSRLIHEFGKARGYDYQAPQVGIPDRLDHVDDLIAEDDLVVQRYTFGGTHSDEWYGLPPTNKLVGTAEVSIQEFDERGANIVSRYFVDELGLVLQLGALDKLLDQARSVSP
jgi:predicted ester cyclase